MTIYVLIHRSHAITGHDYVNSIGAYSSRDKAIQAGEEYKLNCDFAWDSKRDRFEVELFELDKPA